MTTRLNHFPPTTLAVDYGEKRVGLAVSFASLAKPVGIVTYDSSLLINIARIVDEYQVQQILVGLSEGKSAERSRRLGEKIAGFTKLPVLYTDETLSTKIATQKLAQAGRKIDRKNLDHFAAAEFLQEWLSFKKL